MIWELSLCLFEWRFSSKRGFTGLGSFHRICQPTQQSSHLFTMNKKNEQSVTYIVCIGSRWRFTKTIVPDRPVHYQEATDISRSLVFKSGGRRWDFPFCCPLQFPVCFIFLAFVFSFFGG